MFKREALLLLARDLAIAVGAIAVAFCFSLALAVWL